MKIKKLLSIAAVGLSISSFAQSTDSFFNSNGASIRYVTEGEGIPIVLIHGWMADSSMWGMDSSKNTKLKGTTGYKVIALDCRGHGRSDKPHDQAKYGVEMANDVVRLLDHLQIKRAHIVGYSMGSFIAGKIAATYPNRVISVVYAGQAPILATNKPNEGSGEVDVFAKAVDAGQGLGPYILYVSPEGKPRPTMAQANTYADYLFKGKDVKAFAAAGQSLGKLAVLPKDLQKFQGPSLFIYGENESMFVKSNVESALKVVGKHQVKVIEGGTHVTTLLNPQFATTIIQFIEDHKAE